MERKNELYREAGVPEYWVIDPEFKALRCYRFSNGTIFPRTYRATDTVKVEMFPGLLIELGPVFSEE